MRKNFYSLQNEQNEHKTFARQERSKSVRQRVTSNIGDRQCAVCSVHCVECSLQPTSEHERLSISVTTHGWVTPTQTQLTLNSITEQCLFATFLKLCYAVAMLCCCNIIFHYGWMPWQLRSVVTSSGLRLASFQLPVRVLCQFQHTEASRVNDHWKSLKKNNQT